MRARLLTTAAVITMAASPALGADLYTTYTPPPSDSPVYSPQSMVTGHLEIGLGKFNLDIDDIDYSEDEWIFEGAGRANIALGTLNLELETGGNALFSDGFSISTIGVAGHLWGRFNNAALGVYGAVNFPPFSTIYTVGVEGEAYLGPVTLGADASYNWWDFCCGNGDYWQARAWADFYLTPNARIGGEVKYFDISDFNVDGWGAAIDGEYRFSGTPVSLWAEGRYDTMDFGGSFDADVWSGLLGFRLFLDAPGTTLEQHDKAVPWDGGLATPTTTWSSWFFD